MTAKDPRPFGEPVLKHCAAAILLGVRPKDLMRMPVKRVFFKTTYVYDLIEVLALRDQRLQQLNPKEQFET
jgi:hypothetical protein